MYLRQIHIYFYFLSKIYGQVTDFNFTKFNKTKSKHFGLLYEECNSLISLSNFQLQSNFDSISAENNRLKLELTTLKVENSLLKLGHLQNITNAKRPKFLLSPIKYLDEMNKISYKWLSLSDFQAFSRQHNKYLPDDKIFMELKKEYDENLGSLLLSRNINNPSCGICLRNYQILLNKKWLSLENRDQFLLRNAETNRVTGHSGIGLSANMRACNSGSFEGFIRLCQTTRGQCFRTSQDIKSISFIFSPTVCQENFKGLAIGLFYLEN